jgi:hypothetical protein
MSEITNEELASDIATINNAFYFLKRSMIDQLTDLKIEISAHCRLALEAAGHQKFDENILRMHRLSLEPMRGLYRDEISQALVLPQAQANNKS